MISAQRRSRSRARLRRGGKREGFAERGPGRVLACLSILCVSALNAFASQPRRIVSTSPAVTEVLYALGLGDRVVGVTTFCHYPPEASKKTKIGDYMRPNLEVIVGLKPDLVILETTGVRSSVRLGIPTLEVENGTLKGIYESIRRIGNAAGVPERAAALESGIRSELDGIRSRTARLPRRRTLFVAGRTPGRIEDVIAAGRSSHVTELIEIAGGTNLFSDAVATYSKVSLEALIARNPEVIIDMGEMAQTEGVTEAEKRAVVRLWAARMPQLAAVKQGRVYAVASDIFVVPGPRIVQAAREFARMIHPEAGL